MLQKTSKIEFGGMWVFPGARLIRRTLQRLLAKKKRRDTRLLGRLERRQASICPWMILFGSRTGCRPKTKRGGFLPGFRYLHQFKSEVHIDGGEIQRYQWISPKLALEKHREGAIDLAPPTWVSLYQISKFANAADTITELSNREPRFYKTKIIKNNEGIRTALWEGDSSYSQTNGNTSEATHRLIMSPDGFVFKHSAVKY